MAPASTAGSATVAVAYEDKEAQVLRIAASDVAAIAGYNEWADIQELFMERLLYQDLGHLMRLDAENLGLVVEDRNQRAERLLAKAGDRELRTVRARAGDGAAVATVQDAQALRDKAQSLLKNAESSKKLSVEEAKELGEELRYDINTKFGTRNEDVALKVYERRTGTEVLCNNDRRLVWPFPGSRAGEDVPEGALNPPAHLSEGWTKRASRRLKRPRAGGAASSPRAFASAGDSAFLIAVTTCLRQVSIRSLLEDVIENVVLKSATGFDDCNCRYSGEVNGTAEARVGRNTREQEEDVGGKIVKGSEIIAGHVMGKSAVRESSSEDSATTGVDAKERNDSVEIYGAGRLDAKTALPMFETSICTCKRESLVPTQKPEELLPGVPWPEWKMTNAQTTSEKSEEMSEEMGKAEIIATKSAATAMPAGGPRASAAVENGASMPQHRRSRKQMLGLWFTHLLSSRQRAMVHQVARELRLGHASVGHQDFRQVVVWESPNSLRPVHSRQPSAASSSECSSNISQPLARSLSSEIPSTSRDVGEVVDSAGHGSVKKSDTLVEGECSAAESPHVEGLCRESRDVRVSVNPRSNTAADDVVSGSALEKNAISVSSSSIADVGEIDTVLTADAIAKGSQPANSPVKHGSSVATGVSAAQRREILAAEQTQAEEPGQSERGAGDGGQVGDGNIIDAHGSGPPLSAMAHSAMTTPTADEEQDVTMVDLGDKAEMIEVVEVVAAPTSQASESVWKERRQRLARWRHAASDHDGEDICFVVVGAVDGVAEEVTAAPEELDVWETRRVVVEIKNRMARAKDPPPLYDQIQLVTYMLMIGATVGDLVQFVKNRSGGSQKPAKTTAEAPSVTVSRVELDCRPYYHRKHWHASVLPRLYEFARMVYKFRSDDALRWQYLLASPDEQRNILVECCPYLDNVIPRSRRVSPPAPAIAAPLLPAVAVSPSLS